MTHPSDKNKLTKEETKSIENAVKDVGIRAIHPEKMEAYADMMVQKLKDNEWFYEVTKVGVDLSV